MKKLIIIFLLFTSTFLMAEKCATDNIGMVKCAKDPGGEAIIDSIGTVVCGKGQCAVDGIGMVQCSRVSGGGVAVDGIGMVQCQGGCEMASSYNCESPRMY